MSPRLLGLSLLLGVLVFISWVLLSIPGLSAPAAAPEGLAPLALRVPPETPSAVERVPSHEPGPARVLEVEGDRLRVETASGERLYAAGELLPDGRVVVGFDGGRVRIFDGERILSGSGEAWTPVEDFELPPAWGPEFPPLSEGLKRAVLDTFDSILLDPSSAQLAVDALLDAGEIIVPVLGRRIGRRRACCAQFVLPDGRVVAPRDEGALVLVLLEALTGRHFGDPSQVRDPIEREELVATWSAVLGLDAQSPTR